MKKLLLIPFLALGLQGHAQWVAVSSAPVTSILDLTVHQNKIFFNAGSVYSSADGLNFAPCTNVGLTGSVKTMQEIDGQLYAGTNGSSWFSSSDEGASWNSLGGRAGLTPVSAVTFHKNGNILLYGTSNNGGIHISGNNGTSWSSTSFPFGTNSTIHKHIVMVGNELFASTLNSVIKSTDNGNNWESVTAAPAFNGVGTSLTAINGGLLLSVYGEGVHRSVDGGVSWTKVLGGGLGSVENNIITVSYRNGIALAGGAVGGVYYSTDNGLTWTSVPNTDLPPGALVNSVLYHNGYLYAGHNLGMARQSLSIASSTSTNKINPVQLFPNPSNEWVQVSWPGAEALEIAIYDLKGQCILRQDVHGDNHPIDARTFAHGLYLVRLTNLQSKEMYQRKLLVQ